MRPMKMSRRDHLRFLGTGATALAGSAAGVLPFGKMLHWERSPRTRARKVRRCRLIASGG